MAEPTHAPTTLMFIRHAEKPSEHGAPHGVNHHGEPDAHSLSVRGWTRAGALAALFGHAASIHRAGIVPPARIYATQPSEHTKSRREVDTAAPTAERLGLQINESYSHGDEERLAAELLSNASPALTVWHHGNLPALLAELPLADPVSVPVEFPEDRFDLVWVLTSTPNGYEFSCVNQDLLDGDLGT